MKQFELTHLRNKFLLFLLLFFWMFSPVIKITSDYTFKTYIFAVVITAILGAFGYFGKERQSRPANFTLVLIFVSSIYILIVSILAMLKQIVDFNFFKEFVMGTMVFFSAYYIVGRYRYYYNGQYIGVIMYHLFLVGFIHSTIILLTALMPTAAEFLYTFIWLTERQDRYIFGEVLNRRYSGIIDSGFSTLSATHATLMSIGILSMLHSKEIFQTTKSTIYALGILVIFISLIFTGRSGFIVLAAYILMFTICYIPGVVRKKSSIVRTSKILVVIVMVSTLALLWMDFSEFEPVISSSFEYYINYQETGSFRTGSTDSVLEDQLIFPNELLGIIFGTANFGRGNVSIVSDLGFVYLINGVGVFGTIVIFSFHFVLPYYAYRLRRGREIIYYFLLMFCLLLVILNFKDLYLMAFGGMTKIFFLFLFVFHFLYLESQSLINHKI